MSGVEQALNNSEILMFYFFPINFYLWLPTLVFHLQWQPKVSLGNTSI